MGLTTSIFNSEKISLTLPPPEAVRSLSLTDVSQEFKTEGLSVRLIDTLKTTGLIEDELIIDSLTFGLTLHQKDKRIIGRYVDHLIRVTLRIIEDYDIRDTATIATAPVHDAVENHPKKLARMYNKRFDLDDIPDDPFEIRELALKEIAKRLGEEVSELVMILSLPPKTKDQPREEWNQIYFEHTDWIINNFPKARAIKLADFFDNASGDLATDHPKKQWPRDVKYEPTYILQENGLYLPDGLIVGEPRKIAIAGLREQHRRAILRLENGPPEGYIAKT